MSLDITLLGQKELVRCQCSECGNTHLKKHRETLWKGSITHNLNAMVDAVGIYYALWKPFKLLLGCNVPDGDREGEREYEAMFPVYAKDIYGRLSFGLDVLKNNPDYFRMYNSPNGFGTYEDLLKFVSEYVQACEKYMDAEIIVNR
jgi:hypothetical protein